LILGQILFDLDTYPLRVGKIYLKTYLSL